MPRKESITKQEIREAAFNLARQSGMESVTARKLAEFIGCSTQPIFRNYKNMEECLDEVYEDTLKFFDDFTKNCSLRSVIPFVTLGISYISFAQEETNLFRFLFMTKNTHEMNLYSMLNSRTNAVINEMNACIENGGKHPEEIFMKMWMLIHGAACMSVTGDYDLTLTETKHQLEEAYRAFAK